MNVSHLRVSHVSPVTALVCDLCECVCYMLFHFSFICSWSPYSIFTKLHGGWDCLIFNWIPQSKGRPTACVHRALGDGGPLLESESSPASPWSLRPLLGDQQVEVMSPDG